MSAYLTGYYQADKQNGVTYIGDCLEDADIHILRAGLFAEFLEDMEENETMVTFFDCSNFELLEKIDSEYGVKQ
ncbi:MAG: hypothetical protein RL755_21 [Pseudomonadota bacterium]|jgi:hypothetical protein